MESTFETRLNPTREQSGYLLEMAKKYCHAERRVFTQLYVNQTERNQVKRWAISELGITARQYNSIIYDLKGRVSAAKENEKNHTDVLKGKLEAVVYKIEKLKAELAFETNVEKRKRLKFTLHQKKRRQQNLRLRLKEVERKLADVVAAPRLCFGSRKLFNAQHNLEANDYESHAEWKKDWEFARHSQFFLIGSKDETAGCQSSQYDVGTRQLKLRLTNEMSERNNCKYLYFEDVKFAYGQEKIEAAHTQGRAISYRFIARRENNGELIWYVKASIDESEAAIITDAGNGILGVDLNATHVDIGIVSGDGNPLGEERIELDVAGKSSSQSEAIIGNAVKWIVEDAVVRRVPIAVEKLDFKAKKKKLGEQGKAYARMLSSFAYVMFFRMLLRAAARRGVEVREVNPEYTSIIGYVKFGAGYGMTIDGGAAIAIGRRAKGMGEALRTRAVSPSLHTMLMEAQPMSEGKHVRIGWSVIKKRLGRDRRSWPGRCSAKGRGGGRKTIAPIGGKHRPNAVIG